MLLEEGQLKFLHELGQHVFAANVLGALAAVKSVDMWKHADLEESLKREVCTARLRPS